MIDDFNLQFLKWSIKYSTFEPRDWAQVVNMLILKGRHRLGLVFDPREKQSMATLLTFSFANQQLSLHFSYCFPLITLINHTLRVSLFFFPFVKHCVLAGFHVFYSLHRWPRVVKKFSMPGPPFSLSSAHEIIQTQGMKCSERV